MDERSNNNLILIKRLWIKEYLIMDRVLLETFKHVPLDQVDNIKKCLDMGEVYEASYSLFKERCVDVIPSSEINIIGFFSQVIFISFLERFFRTKIFIMGRRMEFLERVRIVYDHLPDRDVWLVIAEFLEENIFSDEYFKDHIEKELSIWDFEFVNMMNTRIWALMVNKEYSHLLNMLKCDIVELNGYLEKIYLECFPQEITW